MGQSNPPWAKRHFYHGSIWPTQGAQKKEKSFASVWCNDKTRVHHLDATWCKKRIKIYQRKQKCLSIYRITVIFPRKRPDARCHHFDEKVMQLFNLITFYANAIFSYNLLNNYLFYWTQPCCDVCGLSKINCIKNNLNNPVIPSFFKGFFLPFYRMGDSIQWRVKQL